MLFLLFNLTCWSFQGFRRSVVKKLISHLRTVGESFNLHIFHGITRLSDTWKTLGGRSRSKYLLGWAAFCCLVSLKFRRVKSMIITLVGRHFLSGCFCWGNIMQCERRLYGISGRAFYRVGKAGCLQKSPAREFAVRARWKRAVPRRCSAVVTLVLQNLKALSVPWWDQIPSATGRPVLNLRLKTRHCSNPVDLNHRRFRKESIPWRQMRENFLGSTPVVGEMELKWVWCWGQHSPGAILQVGAGSRVPVRRRKGSVWLFHQFLLQLR